MRQVGAVTLWAAILTSSLLTAPALAGEAEITTPQVYQAVQMMRAEIEQIRSLIGAMRPLERDYRVSGVIPRQVFTQAQTTFRNANVLAGNLAGVSRKPVREPPGGDIRPADVLDVVNATRAELALIKTALGISASVPVPTLDRRREPSDVLKELIEADRDLSWMGGSTPTWAEIHEQMRTATTYVGGLLDESSRYAGLPPHEPAKSSIEVFDRLAGCLGMMRQLAQAHDLAALRLEQRRGTPLGPTVIEVGALTSLMLVELAEMTLAMDGADVDPPEIDHPARVFPSHVYQLAGLLESQLRTLTSR